MKIRELPGAFTGQALIITVSGCTGTGSARARPGLVEAEVFVEAGEGTIAERIKIRP